MLQQACGVGLVRPLYNMVEVCYRVWGLSTMYRAVCTRPPGSGLDMKATHGLMGRLYLNLEAWG